MPTEDQDSLPEDLPALLAGRHGVPGRLLGPRVLDRDGDGRPRSHHVRAFLPKAKRAWLVAADPAGSRISQPMRRTHPSGMYETILLADPSAGPGSLPATRSASMTAPATVTTSTTPTHSRPC